MLSFMPDKEEEKPIIYKSRHYIECYWRSCSDYAWLGDTHTHTQHLLQSNRIGAHCQNLLRFDSINHYLSACILRYFVFIPFFRWMWFSCVTINQFIIENWFIFLFALCPIQTDSELLFSISASIVCAEFIGCWHNQKQRGKKERMRTSLFEALQLSALYNVLVAFHWTQYPPQNSIQTSPLDNWTTETLIWENFVFAIRLVIFSSTSIF